MRYEFYGTPTENLKAILGVFVTAIAMPFFFSGYLLLVDFLNDLFAGNGFEEISAGLGGVFLIGVVNGVCFLLEFFLESTGAVRLHIVGLLFSCVIVIFSPENNIFTKIIMVLLTILILRTASWCYEKPRKLKKRKTGSEPVKK